MKWMLFLPLLFLIACDRSPQPAADTRIGHVAGHVQAARATVRTVAKETARPDHRDALEASAARLDAALASLDVLKKDVTRLEKEAAKVPVLEAEAWKKDKRIWQLWGLSAALAAALVLTHAFRSAIKRIPVIGWIFRVLP
jgi:predicted transcriptional regulator